MKNIALLCTALLLSGSAIYAKDLRLGIGNGHSASFTEIHFSADAQKTNWRKNEKILKEIPANPLNYIFTTNGEHNLLSRNCPAPYSGMDIPVQILVRDTGTFEILLEDLTNEFSGFQFSLTELNTMQVIRIFPGIPESVYLEKNDLNQTKKYRLNIFEAPNIYPTPVSCFGSENGTIRVRSHQKENCEMRIRNLNNGKTVYAAKGNDLLFENLPAGVYAVEAWKKEVKIWEEFTCVYGPKALKPDFRISADTIEAGQVVYTDNYSAGVSWFRWQTGETSSAAFAPAFVFENPGTYSISLIVADFAGCNAVLEKKILVKETANNASEQVLK